MKISLIAAVAQNGVIGAENRLPWRLPGDLAQFKSTTMGHVVIVGRRTFESIGRPLPGRRMIVLTHRDDLDLPGVRTARSVDEALALAAGEDEVFVAGGGEVYRAFMPRADRIYLTCVEANVEGDTRFPEIDPLIFREVSGEAPLIQGKKDDYPFTFRLYERSSPSCPGTTTSPSTGNATTAAGDSRSSNP
jgi:dihydrofolate reductase